MSRQDDFSDSTKFQLAKRAGFRCSFLGCGSPTYGPSDETPWSTNSIGMACHISAASSGKNARRYNPLLTQEQRSSISNGIWMCYLHGKLIDSDESRFTVEVLQKWRDIAESVARVMVERNREYQDALRMIGLKDLIGRTLVLSDIFIDNRLIGEAISDSGIAIIIGNDAVSFIRDFSIEHIKNAFQHGDATEVTFTILKDRIVISDNGNQFNPKSLVKLPNGSGGALAVRQLMSKVKSKVILTSSYFDKSNETVLALIFEMDDVLSITQCSYKIELEDLRKDEISLPISETCEELFVVLPEYIEPSIMKGESWRKQYLKIREINKPITFIVKNLSPTVLDLILENHPDCDIISLK